jgi:hypothetical protein
LRLQQRIVFCPGAFQRHFPFPRSLEIVRGFAKFSQAFSHGPGELGQLSWAEEDERDYEDEKQLSAAESFENECEGHGSFYLPVRLLTL